MTPDISIGEPRMVSDAAAHTEVDEAFAAGREVSDACAVTIASWWQLPGRPELQRLRETGRFNTTALLQDISLCRDPQVSPKNNRALDMLATWAMHRHDQEV